MDRFEFIELTNGKRVQAVALVDANGNQITTASFIGGSAADYSSLPAAADHVDEVWYCQAGSGGLLSAVGSYKYPKGFYSPNALSVWELVPMNVKVAEDSTTIINIQNWTEFVAYSFDVNEGDRIVYNKVIYENLTSALSATNPSLDTTNWKPILDIEDGTAAGQMIFWDGSKWARTEITEMYWDNTDKRLALGTSNTSISIGNQSRGIVVKAVLTSEIIAYGAELYSNTSQLSPVFLSARGRGTSDTPVIVQNGDDLGRWVGAGFDGTNYAQSTYILFEVDGTPGVNDMPGRIRFGTTPDGAQVPVERMRVESNGHTRIGDITGGNYTETEADGTVKFEGDATVWDDANVGAYNLQAPAGLQPDIDEFKDENGVDTGIATYAVDTGEELSGSIEIPHSYKEGSDITFHVHWQGIIAPTGTDNVQFQLNYTVASSVVGTTLDPVATIVVETGIDAQYGVYRSDFPTITGTNFKIGDQFLFTLGRIAANTNEYAGDALLATVGFHYEADTVGSRQIIAK